MIIIYECTTFIVHVTGLKITVFWGEKGGMVKWRMPEWRTPSLRTPEWHIVIK
jgi:hypothetical protein